MLVKVAPLGERTQEVNVESGTEIASILSIAGVSVNGRSIMLNNAPADEYTAVVEQDTQNIITLANKMKGGK